MSQSTTLEVATVEQAKQLGLLEEEFDRICEILGRTPNFTELSIFSVMWSEHCSYKNSILWLKKLPKEGARVMAKAGEENAGLMDIGDGLAVAFKIESHNHPSAIEPYQGAATGVGGIQRDIFGMGARPVCSLNSLRFGSLDDAKTQRLLKGVVKGIGDYGNAFGVPTVAGEVYFDDCYKTNPLVNAMSVGITEHGKTVSATAEGPGNPVYIFGSATGKDGIHGATFASGDLSEESEKDLPSVQVGDPFQEKLLLEATLEAIETGAVVGMQDMGAAGITCSTSEMSEKGGVGMDIWLDKVPVRQENMKPFEILLSESQERMLVVLEKGKEQPVLDVFEKWDIHYAQIGVVTEGGILKYHWGEDVVAEVPAEPLCLGGGAPVYEREVKEPAYLDEIDKYNPDDIEVPDEYITPTEFLLSLPSIASKRWITTQYDSMVGTDNLSTNQPADAAVIRVKGTDKALVVTTDCNSRYVRSNPTRGCAMAVAEAARNILCSGGEPIGVTNCLNFGNPYNPEVYWQFSNSIMGMKYACEKFGTPVTGGNVSFYNQFADDDPVYPTPTIGMVGVIESMPENLMTLDFKEVGDLIYLIGHNPEDMACSAYVYHYHGVKNSPAPYFNLDQEHAMQQALAEPIQSGMVESAHDISDGGLMICLMEKGFNRELGFDILLDDEIRFDAFLFGEAGGRVIVTVNPAAQEEFEAMMEDTGVPMLILGEVTDGEILLDGEDYGNISDYKEIYLTALEKKLKSN